MDEEQYDLMDKAILVLDKAHKLYSERENLLNAYENGGEQTAYTTYFFGSKYPLETKEDADNFILSTLITFVDRYCKDLEKENQKLKEQIQILLDNNKANQK